ncbi:MAG: hypothetical protein ACXWUG_04620 [Polyangiales bacterium]
MPTRSSKRSELLLPLAFALGCTTVPLKTRDAPPPETSGAVAVDPVPSLPRATDRALSGDGVATLRAPVPREAVAALVRRWFDAFHARDTSGIESDLDDLIVDLRSEYETTKPRSSFVLYELGPRMKSAPFDQVDVDSMYRPQDVEVWAREELGLAGRPARPNAMQADDLLVRIPIAMTRLGSDVLFGDEVKLLLRRDGSKYRIRGYYEIVPK